MLEANAGRCTCGWVWMPWLRCACGLLAAALEHDRDCPVRLAFYGGDPNWDRSGDHFRNGTRYRWDPSAGTWRPVFG